MRKKDQPKKYRDQIFKGIFENILRPYREQVEIFTELEVRRDPRYIDVAFIKKENISRDIPLYTIFSIMNKWNAIEFKSVVDKPTKTIFAKGLGYIVDLLENKNVEFEDMFDSSFCLITVNVPKFLRDILEKHFEKAQSGIYLYDKKISFIVVLINELEIKKENMPLLVFASGEKIEEVIKRVAKSDDKTYLSLLHILHRDEVVKITESMGVVIDPYADSIRKAMYDIGIDRVIQIVGLEEIINQVGLEEVIDEIGLKRVIDEIGLKRVIDEIGLKRVIDEVGIGRILLELGPDAFINSIENEYKAQKITKADYIKIIEYIKELGERLNPP